MENTKRVFCFGEVMLRLAAPRGLRLGQTLPGAFDTTFGGSEASVAASLVHYGTPACYATALPPGPLTQAFTQELRGLGVDVVLTETPGARFGLYFVEQGTGLRGGVVYYDRSGSGVAVSGFEAYRFEELLEGMSGLHISGITPAVSAEACDATLKLVELARQKGIFISCDLNYRAKLWQWDREACGTGLARKWMPRIVEHVDLLVGNESDFSDALGIEPGESRPEAGVIHAGEYEKMARLVCETFPNLKYVASSLRSSVSAEINHWGGMLYVVKHAKAYYAPQLDGKLAPYELQVFDRFGAGDAFVGGLLHALGSDDLASPERAIAFATAAGALKHTIHGDYNRVSREEVLRLMGGDVAGRVQR